MKNGNGNGKLDTKLAPNDVLAEKALLGSIQIEPDILAEVIDRGIKETDFFIERHGWVFAAMRYMWVTNRNIDIVTLSDELEQRGQLAGLGGGAYLTELMLDTPSAMFAGGYADIIKRTSVLRQLINAGGDIVRLAHKPDISDEDAMQAATEALLNISRENTRKRDKPLPMVSGTVMERVKKAAENPGAILGLPMGIRDLDEILTGMHPGNLILLAARPAMGKSALAGQIALNVAKTGKRVLFFSREMSEEDLYERWLAAESGIDLRSIRMGKLKPDDWSRLEAADNVVKSKPIKIDTSSGAPAEMRAKAIIERERYGLDLVIVDYIQRMSPPDKRFSNRDAEIGEISRALKNLAQDLEIPVLAISSLNRGVESRGDKRPIMSDLREGGSLEYDADAILFVYRDEVYNEDTETPGIAEIIISKNRQGPTGKTYLSFQKNITKFIQADKNVTQLERAW
jgi:replicative DNA helicase